LCGYEHTKENKPVGESEKPQANEQKERVMGFRTEGKCIHLLCDHCDKRITSKEPSLVAWSYTKPEYQDKYMVGEAYFFHERCWWLIQGRDDVFERKWHFCDTIGLMKRTLKELGYKILRAQKTDTRRKMEKKLANERLTD
jgi:hypothetical protein